MSEPVAFLDAAGTFLDALERTTHRERWDFTREPHEERDPIPSQTRYLVYARDGFKCAFCGCSMNDRMLQLDHVVPWSAGGCECPPNLRTLCDYCNNDRSNFLTVSDARRLEVTPECAGCQGIEITDEMLPAFCGKCGLVSPTDWRIICNVHRYRRFDPGWVV